MKKIRFWLIQVVGISKTEANGLLILIPIALFILILPDYYKLSTTNHYNNQVQDSLLLNQLLSNLKEHQSSTIEDRISLPNLLQPFDPNIASIEELITIGISNKLAQRIINYRNKGGRFLEKKDLKKIYGFKDSLYNSISSYIQLPDKVASVAHRPKTIIKNNYPIRTIAKFELNSADTSAFKQISGIGEVLSQRIINYRNKLGGFTRTEQLYEVYGLENEVVIKLLDHSYLNSDENIREININTVNEYDLKSHPYISPPKAKAIISFRYQHGAFSGIEDLSKIHLLDSSFINKLRPYLSFTPE